MSIRRKLRPPADLREEEAFEGVKLSRHFLREVSQVRRFDDLQSLKTTPGGASCQLASANVRRNARVHTGVFLHKRLIKWAKRWILYNFQFTSHYFLL